VLNNKGFDLWANDYDKTVQVSEDNNLYPFAGYKSVLNSIFKEVMKNKNSRVLDIGFGTGILAHKLYENGHKIDGLDFSAKMIAIAKVKMPMANLLEWDISNGLPSEVRESQYDAIVSTYTLHHLSNDKKVDFIKSLLPLLTPNGKIFIGDIAFQTQEDLNTCRETSSDYWDHDEFYFVNEEISKSLVDICKCEFHPASHCGGVFILSKY